MKDQGDVAIIELSGNYDRNLPDGTSNLEPRAVIAREFLRAHPDAYDMLVVFTGFPIETGDLFAFFHPVRNDVQGIGRAAFDNSASYGSQGKLRGMIDMADLARHQTDPLNKGFDLSMTAFTHEFLHQFAAYVKYRKPDGSIGTDLLGQAGAHWSYLLDTSASVIYGSKWRDNGDGTFTATAVFDGYSPLDLYLMGFKKKEDVPPFFIIDAPGVDPTQAPLLNATVRGTRRQITVDDIIAAEGPRIPDASQSQKDYRLAFIYAVRPGQAATDNEITALTNIRRAIATRFSAMTEGMANINVFVEPLSILSTGVPAGLPPPVSPPATNINLQQAIAWLKLRQFADGSWADTASTAIRDSSVSALALQDLDPGYAGITLAAQWLDAKNTSSTDYTARKLATLSQINHAPPGTRADELAINQNGDGGWGAAKGYSSNPLDTALAVQTLLRRATAVDNTVSRAFAYLRERQNFDGGWGSVAGGASRTMTTAQVMLASEADAGAQIGLDKAKAFLATRQNVDGGFGDSPSSVHDTGNVVATLMALNATNGIRLNDAMQYLSVNQRVDGSWQDSVYSTALALNVLARANAMNWAVTAFAATPARTTDGQRVTLSVTVKNTGNRNTPIGTLHIYDGDPATGATAVGPDGEIPVLVPGASAIVPIQWNTLGKAGTTTLRIVIDPDRTQQELSTADNVATLAYTVDPAQANADFLVTPADVSFTPAKPTQIPATLTFTALLTNAGLADGANVKVVLWQGTGADRQRVAETMLASFPARSTRPVTLTAMLARPGATTFAVEIDPDNEIAESDESNNQAQVTVSTEAGIDLEVLAADLSLDKSAPRNGEDVQFTVKLRNRGTVDTPDFAVRYTIESAAGASEILNNTIRLKAGEQVTQTVTWRANQTGALKFGVELDANHAVAEGDRSNNISQLPFTVSADSGPSLAVSFKDITVEPALALEGGPLAISAQVRNVGDQAAAQVEVAFYAGDPAQGGEQIGALQIIPDLAPGAAQRVSANWASVPDATNKLIYVVVDPANKIPADTVRDDNRAFVNVAVKSLPDLAVAPGNLKLTPGLPKPGDGVSLEVRVDNLGQQAANNVLVRAFDGDPAAGGVQVGGDRSIATIAPQAAATVVFAWTFPAASGDRVLYVQVDPLQTVAERFRANNNTQLVVGVQSGDFNVGVRYFSPNGDGVLDSVDFTYRLQSPRTTSIQVVNSGGGVVRSYAGAELAGTATGRWTWDGRNNTGSVVRDDDYRIQSVADGLVLGEALVTLDNNRSSIVEAIGTPFARKSNLICSVPQNLPDGVYPRSTEDGSRAYFVLQANGPAALPPGVYRTSGSGTDLRQIVPSPAVTSEFWTDAMPSPDGTRIAITRWDGSLQTLWIANGDGGELRQLSVGTTGLAGDAVYIGLRGFSASGTEVLVELYTGYGERRVAAVAVDSSGARMLMPLVYGSSWRLSPDRRKILATNFDPQTALTQLTVMDVQSGSRIDRAFNWDFENFRMSWAPDSRAFMIAVLNTQIVTVYDAEGDVQRTISLASEGKLQGALWGDNSTELFAYSGGPDYCSEASACAVDAVIRRVGVASGSVTDVYRVPGVAIEGQGEIEGKFLSKRIVPGRVPGRGQLLISERAVEGGYVSAPWITVSTETPYAVKRLAGTMTESDDELLNRMLNDNVPWGFRDDSFDGFREFGRAFYLQQQWDPGDSTCAPFHSSDYQVLRSLKNLTADLRVIRGTSALKLQGSAADSNFARYSLEYARAEAPGAWLPVAPISTTSVIDGELAQWVPPGPGGYLLRLAVDDLAGNRRENIQRVNWGANTLISDLYRSPEYISPNGDGVQDKAVIHYRVLEPVNIEFNIYSDKGDRVLSFTRSHPAAGVEANVEWDGRNASGGVVPDGTYRLTVLDYEFSIKVDSTYPGPMQLPNSLDGNLGRLDLKLEDVQFDNADAPPDLSGPYTPHVRIDWAIADANFSKVVVQRGEGGGGVAPQEWTTWLESNRANIREPYDPFLVPLEAAARQRFRIVASDLAGNVTTQVLPALDEQVIVANYFYGTGWARVKDAVAQDDFSKGLALEVVETVRAPLAQLAIEYQGPVPDGQGPGTNWSERVLPLPTLHPENVNPKQQSVDGAFVTSWDLSELTTSGLYYFRVRLTDQNGQVIRSSAKEIGKVLKLEITNAALPNSEVLNVTVNERIGQLVERLDLLVYSPGDPAFAIERAIWSRPGASTTAGLGAFDLSVDQHFRTCTAYSLRLRATLVGGGDIFSDPVPVSACTFVETTVKPVVAACGALPPGKLQLEMRPVNQVQDNVPLGLLEFGRKRADGTDDILFSKVNPAVKTVYAFELSTLGLPEGIYAADRSNFFARVTDIQNRRAEDPVRIVVDRTPVQARITYPVDNQRLCAKPETTADGVIRSYVDLEATITDAAGFDYVLQSAPGSSPGAWFDSKAEPPACLTPYNRTRDLGDLASPVENTETHGNASAAPSCGRFTALAGKDVAGRIARVYDQNGTTSVRLMARDWGGYQTCPQVTFFVDGKVEAQPASLDRTSIAPGRTDDNGSIILTYRAEESIKISVAVYRKADVTLSSLGYVTAIAPGALPVRRLADARQVAVGEGTLSWNGHDDGDALVADGDYVLLASYEDGCGNKVVEKAFAIQSDRTPPSVEITAPTGGAELSGIVEVSGSVADAHLAGYVLEFGEGNSPQTWTAIKTDSRNVSNAALGSWSTLGLQPGFYTLRLRATDRFGNDAETHVAVTVKAGGALVSYLEAAPEIFSPNGDGRLDQAAVRFGLGVPAMVTMAVYQSALRVRTLVDGVMYPAGAAAATWDGRSDSGQLLADGRYLLQLDAIGDGSASQTVIVGLMLDTTAPQLEIAQPAGGYARGTDVIVGSISDPNLADYSVTLRSLDLAGAATTLDQGTDARSNYAFGSLAGLAEGRYEIATTARDRAENQQTLTRAFVLDNTPPRVSITAPLAGLVVGSKASPLSISGTIDERNFKQYKLNLGQGPPPAAQTELASGFGSPPPVLALLDVTRLPDGKQTLQLIAEDNAGWVTTASVDFTVDNTPPSASISLPAENAYLRQATDIKGVATDANFKQLKLEIAPGPKTTASRFTEFASSPTPIDNGLLGRLAALPPDGVQTIRLSVFDKADNVASVLLQITVDTTPPAVPLNLASRIQNRQDVVLTWAAVADTDLAGYSVFRDGIRITAVPIAAITYTDAGVSEGDHIYIVSAIDKAGNESARSAPITARVSLVTPTAQILNPARDSVVSGVVEIKGTAFSTREFKEYRVSIGEGTSPANYTLLRRSTIAAQGELLAQWNTLTLAENAIYTIQLEAEDTFGTIARDSVTVRIDNRAPARPLNLQASLAVSDVTLTWTPNTEPDLDGYLVYRNEQLVNQIGTVVGDLKPYIIKATTYADKAVPDGSYDYTVVAVDVAGNQSERSAPKHVTVDVRAPKANIVKPAAGAKVDRTTYVLAVSEDNDIAQVQLQYRAAGTAVWADLGAPVTSAPFGRDWDLSALAYGDYELRAVARDIGGLSDAAPQVIRVTRARLDRPANPGGLTASVTGGDVTLNWDALLNSPNLAGYAIDRIDGQDNRLRRNAAPIAATTYVDRGVPDGQYRYTVSAVDSFGAESDPSSPANARVFTPQANQPYTPTDERNVSLAGVGLPGLATTLAIHAPSGVRTLDQAADAQGRFAFDNLVLETGDTRFTVTQRDAAGNTSKAATPHVLTGDRPAKPTGLGGTVSGLQVALAWNANSESNLAGYYANQSGEPGLDTVSIVGATASSESPGSPAALAVDGDYSSFWQSADGDTDPWLEMRLSTRRLVAGLQLAWSPGGDPGYVAAKFVVEGWDGEVWVPLAKVADNTDDYSDLIFARPYFTDKLRVRVESPGSYGIAQIGEVYIDAVSTVPGNNASIEAYDGRIDFSVTAFNTLGLTSQASDAVTLSVGDAIAPDPVSLQASLSGRDVTLTWTASTSSDVVAFEVSRNGSPWQFTDGAQSSLVESGLANGNYRYSVIAIDAVGNRSVPSNEVTVTVAINVPGQPFNLQVLAVPTGRALDLSWSAPANGAAPASYAIERALQSGGPYEALNEQDATATIYRDTDSLINGTRYYYRVFAINGEGDPGLRSNEASGVPHATVAPAAPVLAYPASAQRPATITAATADVAGFAEPESEVTLSINGRKVGTATARAEDIVVSVNAGNNARLSPDGAWVFGSRSVAELHRVYADAAGGQDTLVKSFSGLNPIAISWAAGSRRVAYISYNFDSGRHAWITILGYIDVDELTPHVANSIEPLDSGIATSADGRYAFIVGDRDGRRGLWRVDLQSNTATPLLDIPNSVSALTLSPAGDALAYLRDDRLEVFDLTSGTVRPQSVAGAAFPGWSPAGDAVLYTGAVAGRRQVFVIDFTGSPPRQVTQGAIWASQPAWSPDGARIAYADNGRVIIRDLAGGEERGVPLWNEGRLDWVASGFLAANSNSALLELSPAGHFRFADVLFQPGENRLTAVATVDISPPSANSPPATVIYSTADRPDLALSAGDIVALPGVPSKGEGVRVTVTVRNLGPRAAGTAAFTLQAIDPDGIAQTLIDTRIAALASGESAALVADWTPAKSGTYQMSASVDRLNEVLEISESNNATVREVTVVDSAIPRLEVGTDARIYPQNAGVAITARLVNGGASFSGLVELQIEDVQGFLVAALASQPVDNLAFGQTLVVNRTWNSGATLPGQYRVMVRLKDGAASVVAEMTAAFSIDAPIDATATLTTDRSEYSPQGNVRLLGRVTFASGAGAGVTGDALIRVFDATGQVRFESQRSLPFGTTADVTAEWNLNAQAAGDYLARLELHQDGRTIASASAAFKIVDTVLQPPVVSLVTPASNAVFGAPALIALSAGASSPNAGGSIVKVEFFAGATTGAPKLGEAAAPPYAFNWSGVPAGRYVLVARATDNRGVTADSLPVNVVVNTLPSAAITTPADNAIFTAPASVTVTAQAQDADGTIARIEIFGGMLKLGECSAAPCAVTWNNATAGGYVLTAVATDDLGGRSTSAPVRIVIAGAFLPPAVALTAPASNMVVNAPGSFLLIADASSVNAGGSIAKVEFFQGTTKLGEATAAPYSFAWTNIAAGSYTLTARATDDHALITTSAPVNVIVNALPTVSITAPANNATLTAPADVTINATASDSDGTITKIEIFNGTTKLGECAASPCAVTWSGVAAGSYTLTAKATDNRNAGATSAGVSITVDVGALSGSITLNPATADIGQNMQISAQVQSPSTVAGLPLNVRVYNTTSGATLSEWTTNATLAANTPFFWSFTWNTSGQPEGTYKVAFIDRRTGSDVLIAEAALMLKSAVVVQLSAAVTPQSRVLVLASCHKSRDDGKSGDENHDDDDDDHPDASCAEQRKAYLDELLSELGVTHRVVTDADTFRSELRCGNWNVFWLSGGREKLKDRLAEELGEQVYAGKGLIVDGVDDGRNNGIDDILGVKYKGKLANDHARTVVPADALLAVGNFTTVGRASRFETQSAGAVVHARFDSSTGDPAIVSNPYGSGRALTIAFDLAGTMQAEPEVEANARPLFAKVAPTAAEPGATASARLTVSNSGGAGSATVQAILPYGVTLRSATPSPTTGTSWQLDLAAGGQRTIDLEFNVPAGEGTYAVGFESGSVSTTLTLNIAAISGGSHTALVQTLSALNLSGGDRSARDKAVKKVNDSAAQLQRDPEGALYLLLDAAKEVAKITNSGAAPDQLAQLVVKTASSWCQQMPACMRPDQGTAALGSYQVLVLGDAQFASGSVEGAVGVSGNAQVANLSVASKWSGDSARLVAGANVIWSGGGSVGMNGSGIIRAGGNIAITPSVGRRSSEAHAQTEDWAGLESRYLQLSDQLGQLASTAALAESGGRFRLRGTDPTQNVFTLTGNQTAQARSLVFDVPLASSVIVNVTGASATFANGQQYVMENRQQRSMQQHPFAARVLFNFPQATAISMSNWSIQGTMLAPKAQLSQANGNLFGQIVVDTLWTRNVQFQQCGTFKGTLP